MARRALLILGGTGFVGRHFVDVAVARQQFDLTIASRRPDELARENTAFIEVDREDFRSCQAGLSRRYWDRVIDFSGTSFRRVINTLTSIDTQHYTFLSSSAVDLSTFDDPLLSMAKEKLWCEHMISKGFPMLTVRARFVVGEYDNTNRFEKRGLQWFWKGTDTLVKPSIDAVGLSHAMHTLMLRAHEGVFRAGYQGD